MGLWQDIFGPSKADQLIDVLREDRAATQAVMESTNEVFKALADGLKAQAAIAQKQMDLWTAPTEPPKVRLMTPATEAAYEKAREAPKPTTTVELDSLLSDLSREFSTQSDSFK